MKKIFITGVSGTGKSTIARILNARGIHAISIDETHGLCFWKNKITGEKVMHEADLNEEFIDAHLWVCDAEMLQKLLDDALAAGKAVMAVVGIASNQDDFLFLFDTILLLQCRPETFIRRIMERKDNEFGKDESAQELLVNWYQEFEEELLKKGAVSIDAEKPIEDVVKAISGFLT